ncbi:Hypothetical Protein FCC1311_107492 [Hondaea fermentalgiana]|uniref:LITAF domain-containing protein n=1 Tax=Hondaea fermentalgiana TaxID=2315210 RepID=A0A2R5GVD4_9STRA|nr:Hypothetical Protein FCC1311_107492 [Hondaea fermentalgiana]|eukprot:GBG34525.1 Hypothetical Protein FCC1311_107492 [Hondaea fermentalgiana]
MQPVTAVPVKSGEDSPYVAVPVTATPVNAQQTSYAYQQQGQAYTGQQQSMNQSYQYPQMQPGMYRQEVVYTTYGNTNSGSCPACGSNAPVLASTRSISFGQVLWMIILLIVFWPLFFLPLLFPNCYKQRFVCSHCGVVRYESGDGC